MQGITFPVWVLSLWTLLACSDKKLMLKTRQCPTDWEAVSLGLKLKANGILYCKTLCPQLALPFAQMPWWIKLHAPTLLILLTFILCRVAKYLRKHDENKTWCSTHSQLPEIYGLQLREVGLLSSEEAGKDGYLLSHSFCDFRISCLVFLGFLSKRALYEDAARYTGDRGIQIQVISVWWRETQTLFQVCLPEEMLTYALTSHEDLPASRAGATVCITRFLPQLMCHISH